MNSNMVKPEKLHHLHLVYDFTVPLNLKNNPYLMLISYIFGGKFVKKIEAKRASDQWSEKKLLAYIVKS